MPAECQWLSFSIAFTVLATFLLRSIFTDSPMATGAFMTFRFCVDLQSSHASPCSPGLVGVELEADRAKVLLE